MPTPKQDPDRIQLEQDINDVFVTGTKSINDFAPAYQEILKVAYRFSAYTYTSDDPFIVPRSRDTLDIV